MVDIKFDEEKFLMHACKTYIVCQVKLIERPKRCMDAWLHPENSYTN